MWDLIFYLRFTEIYLVKYCEKENVVSRFQGWVIFFCSNLFFGDNNVWIGSKKNEVWGIQWTLIYIFNLVNSSSLKILCKMCCSKLICDDRYSVHTLLTSIICSKSASVSQLYVPCKKLFMLLLLCTKIKNHLFKKKPARLFQKVLNLLKVA